MVIAVAVLMLLSAFAVMRCFERTGHKGFAMTPSYVGLVCAAIGAVPLLISPFTMGKMPSDLMLNFMWLSMVLSVVSVLVTVSCGLWLGFKRWPIDEASAA